MPRPGFAFTPAEIDAAALVARQVEVVSLISSDLYLGRNNNTSGSTAVRAPLIAALSSVAVGLNSSQTGDAAYQQPFSVNAIGTNLLAVIPGTDLASQYVIIGAHYDHLGSSGSTIWNGAADNAAGVAIVLAVARAIDSLPTPPRRSVIFALWDAEEDGLFGSIAYANAPLVPLGSTVAYVNLDIQGQNLLPALQNTSFAIAAESGGAALQSLVQAEVAKEGLDTRLLSRMFGQDRSDHATFLSWNVPSVFFSDATGACYHTPDDDIDAVDMGKLAEQAQIAFRTTLALAEATTPPAFVPTGVFGNTYADAVEVAGIFDKAVVDLALFAPAQQSILLARQATVETIVANGPGAYTPSDQLTVALAANDALAAVATLPCTGYQAAPIPLGPPLARIGLALALAATGAALAHRRRRRSAAR